MNEIKKYDNIQLRISPNEEEMTQLVRNAQAHVLYTAQPTGLKLKLLNVLFKGRFVICNENMISGTGLKGNNSFMVTNKGDDFIHKIKECFYKDFSESLMKERNQLLVNFDNASNSRKLIEEVFLNKN